jgi:glucose-6-phosphate 1-dehydrogenase
MIEDSIAEANRAMRKFPQPNYVISKVAEEAGEVVKAAIHCAEGRETPENVRGEMRQLVAMLYRLWVEGDKVHGLAAVKPKVDNHDLISQMELGYMSIPPTLWTPIADKLRLDRSD